jgi:hypothetical protein
MPEAVAEIGRVLRPGGALYACITHPMVDSGHWQDENTFLIDEPYLTRKQYEGRSNARASRRSRSPGGSTRSRTMPVRSRRPAS